MGYAPGMFEEIGELPLPSREVLDVGAQDVGVSSAVDLETLNRFIRRFNPQGQPLEVARFPSILEAREVYARAGFSYTCIDVDERPGTLRVDLARFEIPRPRGRYALVVNVGTTEHLASPAATFALMHEMCCEGGILYNDVPLFGLGNHGLINPTPKFWHAIIWMNAYKAHRVNVRTCDESSMDRGNFYHDYLDYMQGLGAIRNVSSLITTVLEKRGAWPFIVPYDAVFNDDDRGHALAGLLAGSYHPFITTGAYTEQEAVAGINHFLEMNARPLRIASLADAAGAESSRPRVDEAPPATPATDDGAAAPGASAAVPDSTATLVEANRLESLGRVAEAIAVCEKALDGTEFPDHYLTLARNYFSLAHAGDAPFAQKALLAALEGIDRRAKQVGQADVEYAVGIIRWARARQEEPPAAVTRHAAALVEANRLESAGSVAEAIAACEQALDGTEAPDLYLTLARNYFGLAHAGDETYAWRALLAALEGIDQRARQAGEADVEYAAGIIRWTLDHFSDWSRLDVTSSYLRSFIADEAAGDERGTAMGAMLGEYRRLLEKQQAMVLANRLYRESPLIVRPGRSDESVAREALFALANQFSQQPGSDAGKYLEGKGLPVPGGYNFQVYDKYLYTSSRAELLRLKARARGVPAVMIACMPKSASEFLAYTTAEVLTVPIVRASIGDPLHGVIVEGWVREILKGGCVLHDHFGGRAENLAALRNCGVTELFVLVRDPRAVAFSLRNMSDELEVSDAVADFLPELGSPVPADPALQGGVPAGGEVERDDEEARRQAPNFARTVRMLSQWIESWIEAEQHGVRVKFVTFTELVSRPLEVMGDVLDQAGAGAYRDRLSEVLAARGRGSNFRGGDDNAWRKKIPAVVAEDAWRVVAPSVRRLLGLAP